MHKQKKKVSIQKRIIKMMLLIALVQAFLYVAILLANGGLSYLQDYSAQAFLNMSTMRRDAIEDQMVNRWSRMEDLAESLGITAKDILEEQEAQVEDLKTNPTLNDAILESSVEDALSLMETNSTVEVYVMLQGFEEDPLANRHCGFLLRDLDPDTYAGSKDILMEVGQNTIARRAGIALDSYWTSRFLLDDVVGSVDFYDKPMAAAVANPDLDYNSLGYWSEPFRWNANDIRVFSYTVPIKVDAQPIGVLGITISADYIETMINPAELSSDGRASYGIGVAQEAGKQYRVYFSNGTVEASIMEDDFVLKLQDGEHYNLRLVENRREFVSVQRLGIYNSESPYGENNWVLLAVEPEESLFAGARDLYKTMIVALLGSLGLALCIGYLMSRKFTNPIVAMAHKIKHTDYRDEVKLESSGLEEIDALGTSITVLNENVRENAAKIAKILELIDLPLGVVEYQEKADTVFCTQKVVDLLQFNDEFYENGFLDKIPFDEFLKDNHLKEILVYSTEKDCYIRIKNREKWLHFKSHISPDGKVILAISDITTEVKERRKMEHERDYDSLTNLLNRRAFKRIVQESIHNAASVGLKNAAMIMWDLDNLKYVNDTYGHDYGDIYICKAAGVFATLSAYGGVVGRISGDEFMAFVPNFESKQQMLQVVQEIKEKLYSSKLLVPDANEIAVRASGGIAWYPDDGKTYQELKKYADYAMYDTKNSYKGAFKEFDRSAYEKDYLIMHAKEELNIFIDDIMIRYAFQPIVDAKTGEIYGYEALMRPMTENMNTPSDVMRIATMQSKLPDIERLTLAQGMECFCKQIRSRSKKLFINSIPNQLLGRDFIMDLLDDNDFDFSQVVVEIIENEQSDMKIMELKRNLVRSLGGEIAVDDFGSGYSSESVLLHFGPDYVKIDMDIVQNVHSDKNRQALVHNLVSYCHPRNIKVIGEGVETKEDMMMLLSLEVDYLQGFYLARPAETPAIIPQHVVEEIQGFYIDTP